MIRVFQMVDRLSEQDLPVLITGETGTGKELVARALHSTGPRREGPFVVFHCASLPPELFESELFGHEAGAFTGADISREGLLDCASGGTVLLDEVSSLSLETQAKLLRVLDTGLMRPLGSTSERAVDVRFLAATNRDLHRLIAQKAVREDLYYRLGTVEIRLPRLEARRGDVPHLARHFLVLHSARLGRTPPLLRPDAIQCLEDHAWPGNVRELEAVLLRLLFESPTVPIDAEAVRRVLPALSPETRATGLSTLDPEAAGGKGLEELHRDLDRVYLTRLFRESGGNLGCMMETLGVKRSSLYRWFRRVGVDPAQLRREL
jgi:DNA-binding NtrC family response regulator